MIVDAYAGPRGWSEGLRAFGLTDIGIELDAAACATAAAAGHRTIRADVARFPLGHLVGRVTGLIMSPPCQAFSTAGTGAGRDVIPELADAISRGDWAWSHDDDRVRHVLEVGRWAETLHPTWIACEQVPPVLPLWRAYADRWRHRYGWSCWAGVLNAADFGVPQTRRRAFLIARTDGGVALPPAPTHCDGGALTLDGELLPWVSMADALGWGVPSEPSPVVMTARNRQTGHDVLRGSSWRAEWFARQQREGNWVLRTGANSMVTGRTADDVQPYERTIDRPAPTLDSKTGSSWKLDRRQTGAPVLDPEAVPAPTMTGTAIGKGVWTVTDDTGDSIRLTIRDALTLQGFPPDYPVQGGKTSRFEQIGNAVPPPLAAAVIGALTAAQPLEVAS